ncbi:related to MET10 - sulfite reductase flavin-binding subunit [Melanopsichium pennsylvanicum]|uniref:assimilatory sulfite reductase (NADPH) n=2 Tax=Melanopsichium pennsylvanicum TaxID=63383 RepID=A0AAJ5C737_9BASI|nr:related to MET10-sulfite reductase flavin-binding subunit [Melanopsichium pennsylvanicum 4]SNX86099.1 related to MET10 - sulfite reductase flavin-binding subunit [Melanopsichium pennsylvanicum]
MAATSSQSLYQSAAIFAGGLAIGAGTLALSRAAFAPAHKPNKSIKRKVSDAKLKSAPTAAPHSNSNTTAATPKHTPLAGINNGRVDPPASKQLDNVDAKGAGPTPPPKPELPGHVAPNGVDATAGGQKLTGLVNAQPDNTALPEPATLNRAKHTHARMDLGIVNGPSDAHLAAKIAAQSWLLDAPNSILTSTRAIDSIAYANSTAIFSYESDANGGFGSYSEKQAQHAAQHGLFKGLPSVFKMQTRAGAANAIVGYLNAKTGSSSTQAAKVVTALTNAAGFAAMAPTLASYNGSDNAKLVLQVSAATHSIQDGLDLNVSNDYASILAAAAALGDSFEVLLSATRQEAVDFAQYAYQANKNVIHIFDGAFSGREVGALTIPTKGHKLDAPEPFLFTGSPKAQTVLVVPSGSYSQAARAVLVTLPPALRHNVALLSVRTLRSWDDTDLRKALPKTVESLHVLEEVAGGNASGQLYEDIVSTVFGGEFAGSDVPSHVFPVALAPGHNLTAAELHKLLETLGGAHKAALKVQDVLDEADETHADLLALSGASVVTFFDSETSATAPLAQLVARAIRERGTDTQLHARLLSRYDNFEASGIVRSDIIISSRPESAADAPIVLAGEENAAKVLVVSDPATTLKSYAPFQSLVRGGTVIFNTPGWEVAELDSKLRAEDKRVLAQKSARLLLVDAAAVVEKLNTKTANASGGKAKVGDNVVPAEIAAAVLLVAVIRVQLNTSGAALSGFLKHVLGNAPVGIDGVEGLVSAAESAIQLHAFSDDEWSKAEPISEAEENAPLRPTQIRYNGFGPNPHAATVGVDVAPTRSTWAQSAWQHLFSEAYGTDVASLRPDLAEQTWVVQVTENRRLTPVDYDRNVFHMELSTKGTDLKYEVGEALGVHGWNDDEEVAEFIKWGGFDADEVVNAPSLTQAGKHESRTVFQTLQQNLDIFGKPPKRFYEELGKLATNRDEARWLRFISSAEGSYTFKKLSEIETVTYADVLRMFPSARLPIDQLINLVEPIKPRHYSIASAQAAVGESIHLLIVTVDWKTPSGSPRYGQCTRYLSALKPGAKVTVSLKPSVMKLPPIDSQPIIMAGLGTGAAPFRAFIQARAHKKAQGVDVGPLVYYFGSRYRSSEYLYGEELEAYTQDGVIQHMGLAFSRDTSEKVYIQHKILQDGDMLTRYLGPEIEKLESAGGKAEVILQDGLINDQDVEDGKKGYFFVCGPTWPVPDIHEALVGAFVKKGLTKQQAEIKMEALKEDERYVLEVY